MDAFAERRMMTPTKGEQRARFFGGVGLNHHSSARHQHRGVEDSRLRFRFEFADLTHSGTIMGTKYFTVTTAVLEPSNEPRPAAAPKGGTL
jgi:hypothetical protein